MTNHYVIAVKTGIGIQIYSFITEERRKSFIEKMKSEEMNLKYGELEYALADLIDGEDK